MIAKSRLIELAKAKRLELHTGPIRVNLAAGASRHNPAIAICMRGGHVLAYVPLHGEYRSQLDKDLLAAIG
jgi:hypothetical protein